MKKLIPFIIVALFIALQGVAQQADPDSTNPGPGCQAFFYFYTDENQGDISSAGYPYHFIDQTYANVVSWKWDFGDGTTSIEQNPVHHFSQTVDTVLVCLSIVTADNCESQTCKRFAVGDWYPNYNCQTGFTVDILESFPPMYHFIPVNFDSLATYWWDFGDGTYAWDFNPVHRYEFSGNYIVCLNYTSADGCTAIACDTIQATGAGAGCKALWEAYPGIITDNTTTANGDTSFSPSSSIYFFQDFSKGNIIQWNWSFGDGTGSAEQNPMHYFGEGGVYNVCLEILTADSCTSKYCNNVYVDTFQFCNLTGKVKSYSGLDGCGLMIVLDNGEVIEPAEMVPDFLLYDGQRVQLAYTELYDRASICMAGKIVRIDCIREIPTDSCCVVEPQPMLCDYFLKLSTDMIFNNLNCNGTATAGLVDRNGVEVAAADFLWSTGETGTNIYNLCPGYTYSVIVTDVTGCAVSGSFSFDGSVSYPDTLFGYWNYQQDDKNFVFNLPVYTDSVRCEWDFGDGTVADGTSVNHSYDSINQYTVTLRVFDNLGNLLLDQEILVTPGAPAGLTPLTERALQVYPVPVNDILYLKMHDLSLGNGSLSIYNSGGQMVLGRQVLRAENDPVSIDVSELPAGFYIGKYIDNSGPVHSFRFVK